MEIRKCARSGLELSCLGIGCWCFGGGDYWGNQDQDEVERLVRRAVDLGITYFDTAEAYNDGRSEVSLGKALKGLPREDVIIGSKISPSNAYPEKLIEHCEASLKRLGMDYLDLYMLHWPIHSHSMRLTTDDPELIANPPDVEDTVGAMKKLQLEGKIRHIGVSNFAIPPLREFQALGAEIAANQLPYSLIARAIENEVLPYCEEEGIGVTGYMTIWQGLFADSIFKIQELSAVRRRTRHFDSRENPLSRHQGEGFEVLIQEALDSIRSIALESDLSPSATAIAWAISNPAITSALVGVRSVAQLENNVRAAEVRLSEETVARLDAVTEKLKIQMGSSFDYFEHPDLDRTVVTNRRD